MRIVLCLHHLTALGIVIDPGNCCRCPPKKGGTMATKKKSVKKVVKAKKAKKAYKSK